MRAYLSKTIIKNSLNSENIDSKQLENNCEQLVNEPEIRFGDEKPQDHSDEAERYCQQNDRRL